MLDRFKYLIVGTAIISSLALTLLAMPATVSNVKVMDPGGCKQVITDNGDSCHLAPRRNLETY